MQQNGFMSRSLAAQQFHLASRAIQFFRQQFHERQVGGGIHGRRRDMDLQLIAKRGTDCRARGARL